MHARKTTRTILVFHLPSEKVAAFASQLGCALLMRPSKLQTADPDLQAYKDRETAFRNNMLMKLRNSVKQRYKVRPRASLPCAAPQSGSNGPVAPFPEHSLARGL